MLLFNACDDFLDVRPKSEKVENEQFKDAQGFEDAIYGVYGELQNTYSYGRFMYWGFTEVLAQNLACYQDQAENTFEDLSDTWYTDAILKLVKLHQERIVVTGVMVDITGFLLRI